MNNTKVTNILYHGRFQPPHQGHILLIQHFLDKYPKAKIIISIDIRNKDNNNPLTFNKRRNIFEESLKTYKERITITSHKCKTFTFNGCLPEIYNNSKQFGEVDLVIGGPDLPEEVKDFWRSKGIPVEIVEKRFLDLSASEIRMVLNPQDKGFSIITAFGCKYNHWYCVWRLHRYNKIKTSYETTNWDKLNELIKWYQGPKINVSGGLDPLFNYKGNKRWWDKLFKIAKKHNKLVDVHTREFVTDPDFLTNINKIVVSFDRIDEIKNEIGKYKEIPEIRLAKVIMPDTSYTEIKDIITFGIKHHFDITFKQLYGFDDKKNFELLKKEAMKNFNLKENRIMFLEHSDYNIYFMPDNRLYDKFII